MPYSPSAIWSLIQITKQHNKMYNGRLHIYFIQHKNDAIYTTLNTQTGLYILFHENSKKRPGCIPPCWPKQRLCHCCWQASSLHGDLKFSHVLLHVTARGLCATVKYCVNSHLQYFFKVRVTENELKVLKNKNPLPAALRNTTQYTEEWQIFKLQVPSPGRVAVLRGQDS